MTLNERRERLSQASAVARIALLAGCAERVIQIHEAHWVGDYAPELVRVIEQAWVRACGGTIDSGELAANRSALEQLVAFYNDESIGILANCSTLALRIAQCLEASTEQDAVLAVARGTSNHLSAAMLVDHAIHDAKAPGYPAEAEERAWQTKAFERIATWQGVARRNMFADFGPLPPTWWAAYQASKNPI